VYCLYNYNSGIPESIISISRPHKPQLPITVYTLSLINNDKFKGPTCDFTSFLTSTNGILCLLLNNTCKLSVKMLSSLAILSLVALSAAQAIQPYSGKDDGLSQHTIYMPNTQGKVPVLVFSSGGCFRDGMFLSDRLLR
jgi:hypothetical protein